MTGPWLVRRVAGDARRHAGVWVGLALAFALAAFCAGGARAVMRVGAQARVEPAGEPARIIAYLDDALSADAVAELQRVLARLPGVASARVVAPAEALAQLRGELGTRAAIVDGVGAELMFQSIEISARPADTASALAFRLRRVSGVADVDLVESPAVRGPRPGPDLSPRGVALAGSGAALAVALALAGALARLRRRAAPELRILATLGLSRRESAGPSLSLAMLSTVVGVGVGGAAVAVSSRAVLGSAALPAREWATGALALVIVAYVLSMGVLRVRDVANAH